MTEECKEALECIVEILESYVEFIDIVEYSTNFADMPYKIEKRLINTIKERRKAWKPLLEKTKKDLEKYKTEYRSPFADPANYSAERCEAEKNIDWSKFPSESDIKSEHIEKVIKKKLRKK